jgi:thiol reductant ABC exporter CydD subunit
MAALDRRLLRRTRTVRVLLACDVALGLVAALLVLAQAVLLADVATRSFDGASLAQVTSPLELLALVVAGRAAASWAFVVVGRRTAGRVLSGLRMELVERRLRGRPSALDGADSAELATVAVAGIEGLESTFSRYLPQVVLATVVPVAVLALVAAIDLPTAGVMLLTLPLVPVFMWLIGRYTERRTRERWQALSLLSTHFADVVRGLPTLRAFNRSRAQAEQVAAVSDRYRKATMGTLRAAFLSGTVLELAATIGVALVAVTVGVRLAEGWLGFQAGLTVLVLAPELYAPIRNLAAQFHASADGAAVSGRLLDLIDASPQLSSGPAAAPDLGAVPLRLEKVSLSYPGRDTPAVDHVTLELAPGETTALVGASGAGKSTVASLLLRLAEPTSGRLVAGTVDAARCSAEGWRRQVAWVPQRPSLLRGTVADNIRLADLGACDERVLEAAALAGADSFVSGLPDGYATLIGDGGRPLSAGQVQRIALARAFLRDAALVVLDEPTANLDPESVECFEAAFDELRKGRTVLLIAHRPELAERADRIVRIENGRVAEPLVEVAA